MKIEYDGQEIDGKDRLCMEDKEIKEKDLLPAFSQPQFFPLQSAFPWEK